MNIGLILFVSSLLLGNTGDKSTNTANENQSPETIVSKSTKSNDSSFDDQVSVNSVQIPADITATETLSNYSLRIYGNAQTKIKQDEHYVFTPFGQDINNEQLNFSISNKVAYMVPGEVERKNLNTSDSSAEFRPLLYKGNNPFTGKVDGKNYWIGYPN